MNKLKSITKIIKPDEWPVVLIVILLIGFFIAGVLMGIVAKIM